jgi:hypothetical protein
MNEPDETSFCPFCGNLSATNSEQLYNLMQLCIKGELLLYSFHDLRNITTSLYDGLAFLEKNYVLDNPQEMKHQDFTKIVSQIQKGLESLSMILDYSNKSPRNRNDFVKDLPKIMEELGHFHHFNIEFDFSSVKTQDERIDRSTYLFICKFIFQEALIMLGSDRRPRLQVSIGIEDNYLRTTLRLYHYNNLDERKERTLRWLHWLLKRSGGSLLFDDHLDHSTLSWTFPLI